VSNDFVAFGKRAPQKNFDTFAEGN